MTSQISWMGLGLALSLSLSLLSAQTTNAGDIEVQAVDRVRQYLQVDTTNPPGNESRAVEFFSSIFDIEGVAYETAESAPGRGNIWARLQGGSGESLVLLHHSDVVPANADYWDHPPLSGAVHAGYIYGRGALDTKSLGIMHLQTFLALHRAKKPLNRDVIFMATADEEAGGLFGAGWLVENRPELFEEVGFLLNEGGGGAYQRDGETVFRVGVTQKVPWWLRLVSTGQPGHGSRPRLESATSKLIRALANIQEHQFEPRIVPAVDAYFKGLAPFASPEWRDHFSNMATAVRNSEVLLRLQIYDPSLHALTRNTCSINRFEGSEKINVVPPEAFAELDCRLLPDQDPQAFLASLQTIINDPDIKIEKILGFTPAVSPTGTDLFEAMVSVLKANHPDAHIVPSVGTGFTDSHFFRDLGIISYGFTPDFLPPEGRAGVHGNNERIPVDSVKQGTRLMLEIVEKLVY